MTLLIPVAAFLPRMAALAMLAMRRTWAGDCRPARRSARGGCAGLALSLLMAPSLSWAVLGGDLGTVQGDQLRLRASRTVSGAANGASVHEIRLADGSSMRQFVNANGIVFAVAWSTRLKPDFAQMLGRYVTDFDAANEAPRAPGIARSAIVDRGDLVVHSAGRLNAFVGKAWIKSQVPAGASPDAIR